MSVHVQSDPDGLHELRGLVPAIEVQPGPERRRDDGCTSALNAGGSGNARRNCSAINACPAALELPLSDEDRGGRSLLARPGAADGEGAVGRPAGGVLSGQ